jgi:chromosomal replication initiation ATPase DnaA
MSKDQTPTIDWAEARRLAAQSETMCKLILAAVNGAAAQTSGGTNRLGKRQAAKIPGMVATWFGFTRKDLLTGGRTAELAWARQVAMYFCRELTIATMVDVGIIFGKDHTNVGHAVNVVNNRIETEARTAEDIIALRTHLLLKLK